MLKSPNKRVWCVLVKGLRLKAETIVGTETTRQVENDKWVRNDLLQMFVVFESRKTLFAAETMFLWLGLLGSNRNWKKKLRYIVILRETGFRNIPMKYFEILIWNIYSQITTKMAVTTSMAALYAPFCTDRYTTTSIFCFLRTFILKQTHMCVCY